jgi:glycosyltransferase involved in cell wall biosynthesis
MQTNHIKSTDTIIIPVLVYNHEKYIEECLNSILAQNIDIFLDILILNYSRQFNL